MSVASPAAVRQTPEVSRGEGTPSRASAVDWNWLLRLAGEWRGRLVRANLVAFLVALARVPGPLIFPILVDEVLLGRAGPYVAAVDRLAPAGWRGPILYIGSAVLLALALRAVSDLLDIYQAKQFLTVSKELTFRLRRLLLQRLGRISMAEYEVLGSGRIASHFVTDLATIEVFVGTAASRFLIALLNVAGVAVVLLWLDWRLGLFILLFNPLVVHLTMVLGRRLRRLTTRQNRAVEEFQEELHEVLGAIHQIRSSNREGHFLDRLTGRAQSVQETATAVAWRTYAGNRLSYGLFLLGFDVFRAVTMLAVVYSSLTIGQMVAVFGYLWFLMKPVQDLLGIQYSYFGASAALVRINRFFAMEEEPVFPHLEDPFRGPGGVAIEARGLTFGYGVGPRILDGLDLSLAPGERVALVGASGSGKSTLVRLLLGLYPLGSGEIRYGGVPVERIGWDVVREHVGTVLQEPALLNSSVRENLALGAPREERDLWRALEVAQLADVVADLPRGLDTVIGRQGVRFSGGQRQRLAIARLLLTDPAVVILDEATSALDSEIELRLHLALTSFLAGRTTLLVAHRLSAIQLASRVLVLAGGAIVEEGRFEELQASGGAFAQLVHGQLRAAERGFDP